MDNLSIRFFDNREVRAVWDDQHAKWWFSVLDIIAVLTDQDDYEKTRNYWKYLKAKLKQENSQVVSKTTQLKHCIDWSRIEKSEYMQAMRHSVVQSDRIRVLLQSALTDQIESREMFLKGIDASYYYEEE